MSAGPAGNQPPPAHQPPLTTNEIYSQVGPLVQYYLSWREKLLVGYVAVLAGLAAVFLWFRANQRGLSPLIPFVGAALSVAFWFLDKRNRELFYCCIESGQTLEGGTGLYSALFETKKTTAHSTVIAWLFFGIAGLLVAYGAALIWVNGTLLIDSLG